ncbi:hypothetical protein G7Y89_g2455 [Cudoniella acicularis]|uniref:Uncharacterized protein n=1 Tax=Cudoniella acicularis TaxID=354080 RepID=A0A8H4RV61_9HELO|nr:hypothetical protein G7Y89_g2455 [Cudoniella acicularis]
MASSLVSNPYTAQPIPQNPTYTYVTAPQPPPSPPVDETSKCSLPSISSLLGLADGSSPEQTQQTPQQAQSVKSEYRPGSGHQQFGPSPAMSTRGALPPTPPMQSDSAFDGRQSPSVGSNSGYSVASAPGYYFSPPATAINNVEPHAERQHVPTMPQRRVSMPAASIAYNQAPFNGSQYNMSPNQQSMSSYYPSPMQQPAQSQISALYYQRPLPQSLSPHHLEQTHGNITTTFRHHLQLRFHNHKIVIFVKLATRHFRGRLV